MVVDQTLEQLQRQPDGFRTCETIAPVKRFRSILVGTLIGAAVAVPLVSVAGSDTPTLPNPSDRWIEVTTANFTIFSNASEKTTRTAGANLEQLRSVLASLFGGMKLTSPVPTYIFIFDDLKSFIPYSSYYQGQAKEIAGFFGAGQFANHVAIVSNQYSTDVSSTIYHEYLHYVLRNNRAELPLWINEGLAELYSTFDVGDGVASIGIPITNHIRRLLNSPLIPLSELIAIDHDSPEYNEGSRRGVFYAQSWALTHMMVMGDGGAVNRATIYSGLLRSGMNPEDAFLEALGGSYKEIEKELNRYIRGKEFTYSQFAVDSADVDPVSITEMAASEILVRLGMLLISLGPERHAFAAEHFRAALAIDENCGPAFAGLGRIDDLAGRIDDAIARYQRAAEIEPDDFMVNILLGSALYSQDRRLPVDRRHDRADDPGAIGAATGAGVASEPGRSMGDARRHLHLERPTRRNRNRNPRTRPSSAAHARRCRRQPRPALRPSGSTGRRSRGHRTDADRRG